VAYLLQENDEPEAKSGEVAKFLTYVSECAHGTLFHYGKHFFPAQVS
jgi:hypothetical protein